MPCFIGTQSAPPLFLIPYHVGKGFVAVVAVSVVVVVAMAIICSFSQPIFLKQLLFFKELERVG